MKNIYSYWAAFVACLGGFLLSYTTCIIAGAMFSLSKEFQLTPLAQGHIAGIIVIGAICGALSAGFMADRWGRKKVLWLSACIYVATALAAYGVHSVVALLAVRFLTGIAVGLSSMVVPVYLAEIAPAAKRGAFVTGYQFFITIGTLVAYLVSLKAHEDWRFLFAFAAFFALFQCVALFFFPESPKWLQKTEAEQPTQEPLFSRKFLFLLILGFVLAAFQQFSGINAVIYFTPKIFAEAGFSDPKEALFATVLVGILNVFSTFVTLFVIDRWGRRKLLLLSQLGVVVMLGALIWGFATESQWIDLLAVGGVLLYVFLYSLGLGPIVWVLVSEIFPLAIRAKALSFLTFVSWSSNYLVVLTFPHFLSSLGTVGTFSLYAVLSLFALLFYWRYLPETKGKSLEALEKELTKSD